MIDCNTKKKIYQMAKKGARPLDDDICMYYVLCTYVRKYIECFVLEYIACILVLPEAGMSFITVKEETEHRLHLLHEPSQRSWAIFAGSFSVQCVSLMSSVSHDSGKQCGENTVYL